MSERTQQFSPTRGATPESFVLRLLCARRVGASPRAALVAAGWLHPGNQGIPHLKPSLFAMDL